MVLPKHMRLKGHRCFDYIYREGSRFYSPSMVLRVTKANKKIPVKGLSSETRPSIKCAISISNKVSKKSVIRNKLRRLFHHHLSSKLSNISVNNEIWAYEGGPASGDLIINLLAGITLIGLPFTFGALVRALWVRYKITTRRISVTGGWLGRDKTQIVYNQISEIRAIPRGLGSYGDMVLVLNDGARLEIRSIPNFREVEAYILEKIQKSTKDRVEKDVKGFSN